MLLEGLTTCWVWFKEKLQGSIIRQPISAEKRLAIILRYFASGDNQQSIAFLFKVGHSTVNGIINEVCDVL